MSAKRRDGIWRYEFWMDVAERAVATSAQAAVSVLVLTATVQEVDWRVVGGSSALAGFLAVLKCLAGQARTGTAAVVDSASPVPPPAR